MVMAASKRRSSARSNPRLQLGHRTAMAGPASALARSPKVKAGVVCPGIHAKPWPNLGHMKMWPNYAQLQFLQFVYELIKHTCLIYVPMVWAIFMLTVTCWMGTIHGQRTVRSSVQSCTWLESEEKCFKIGKRFHFSISYGSSWHWMWVPCVFMPLIKTFCGPPNC